MPTYSYRCTECENAFDIQQAFTDDSLTECPVCAGRLRKVFGAVGISFSGSGFYRNDSRAAERSGAEKKDKGSSDAGSGSSSSDSGSSGSGSAAGKSDSGSSASKSDTKAAASTSSASKPAASSAPAAKN